MISWQIYTAKCNPLSSFKPPTICVFMLVHRKYRQQHALAEKTCLFYQICYRKPPNTLLSVLHSKEKPIIVTISVKIVFNQQIVLSWLFRIQISPTNVTTLKISIDTILQCISRVSCFSGMLLELFETFPIIVDQRIDALKPTLETFTIGFVGLQSVVNASELFLTEVVLQIQVIFVHHF